MTNNVIQPSFSAGELSPSLYGRVDLAKFHVGVALARNVFVDYRGGLSTRCGTSFVGQCRDSTTVNRLIPFQFSTVQTYALVFGGFTMRVVMNGAYVTEPAKTIVGITQANPGVLNVVGHGFSTNDLVFFGTVVGMKSLTSKFGLVQVVDANHFFLHTMFGANVDTSALPAFTSGTISRVFTLATPYAAADLATLKFTQSADTMTLTHASYAPQALTRTDHWVWTLTTISFVPTNTSPTGVTATPSNGGATVYNYVVTAVGENGLTESLPSSVAAGSSATMSTTAGAKVTVGWTGHAGDTLYNVYRTPEVAGVSPPTGSLFGYVGSVTPSGSNTFVDINILPDFTRCPPQGNNPFAAGNNPFCSSYYQQRQVFGGQVNSPQALVFSRSGDFHNLSYSVPERDDDDIEVVLASQKVNAIKHLVPLNSLIVLTDSGAWRVDGGTQSDAVTPTHILAVPQAYNGCSDVPPLVINYDVLYVQAKGSIVRDLSYNFYINVYTGSDISMLSNHLFFGHQITEWTWAEEPFKVVNAVRDDGIILSMTYVKEQEVYGWCRHDTQGLYKSICSISEGSENAVYLIVERSVQGQLVQYIERVASRKMGGDGALSITADPGMAWAVDCGLRYPLQTRAATLTPTALKGNVVVQTIVVPFGGSGYTNPQVVISDATGSGASALATVVGGVITQIVVNSHGTGYTRPTVQIVDPTGSGAVATTTTSKPVTMYTNTNVFTTADVGSVVRVNGGYGVVLSVPLATQIVVDVKFPLTSLWPTTVWSITPPVSSVSGLDHLEGCTVAIVADGNVQPSQTVVGGSIALQTPASLITAGLPFVAQIQSLYLDVQGEATIQGKRKKLNAVTLRVQDTRGLQVGPDFDHLVPLKERSTEAMGQPIQLFTGDKRVVIDPLWQIQGQVCVQQSDPLPATLLAWVPEITVGDN